MPEQRLAIIFDGRADGANKAMAQVTGGLGKTASAASSAGAKIGAMGAKIGSALAAIGIARFLKNSVAAALKAEVSYANLKVAVDNTGLSYDLLEGDIRAAIRAESDLSAFSGGQLRSALTALTQTTGSVAKAQEYMGLATDLARAKHMDLEKAAQLVGRVSEGNVGILKRYGIVLDANATASEALASMQDKFGGAAEAYGNTTQGQMDKAQNAISRLQTTIGTTMLPTLGKFATATADLLTRFDALPDSVKEGAIATAGIGVAALVAAPYLQMLGKAITAAGTAAKALAGWNVAATITGIGIAASEVGAAVSLLAGGEGLAAVASLGGAATLATGLVAGVVIVVGTAIGLASGALINMIPGVKEFQTEMGTAMGQAETWQNSLEIANQNKPWWVYAPGPGGAVYAVQTLAGALGVATAQNDMLSDSTESSGAAADTTSAAQAALEGSTDSLAGATDALTDSVTGYTDSLIYAKNNLSEEQTAQQRALVDQIAVKKARDDLTDAIKKFGKGSGEAELAQINLTEAMNKSKDSSKVASDANAAAAASAATAKKKWDTLAVAIERANRAYAARPNAPLRTPGTQYVENAEGGFNPGTPELTLWGEDGPEIIFPLSLKYRDEAMSYLPILFGALGMGSHTAPAAAPSVPSGSGVVNNFNGNVQIHASDLAEIHSIVDFFEMLKVRAQMAAV